MKSKVLDRPMFKKKGGDIDPENVGIMQGFKDMLGELELDDDMEEEGDETEKVSGRTPDSPEILMNNLRGDMRSIDARVEELADLVGYGAAMETPTQVLALLQPVLGSQEAVPATPPAMMPPPMPADQMAQAPMPMAQGPMPPGGIGSLGEPAPVAMRNGGIVQRFKDGSDEEAVTTQSASYPPEIVERARSEVMKFINQAPLAVPDLAAEAGRTKRGCRHRRRGTSTAWAAVHRYTPGRRSVQGSCDDRRTCRRAAKRRAPGQACRSAGRREGRFRHP